MTSALGVRRVRVPFRVPFETAAGTWAARESLIVELRSEAGARGVGEAPIDPAHSTAVLAALIQRLLDGPDAWRARRCPTRVRGGARGAVLDLAVPPDPVASAVRAGVRVNATLSAGSVDESVAAAVVATEAGFGTLKLKAGARGAGSDARRPGPRGAGSGGPGRRPAAGRERHLDAGRGDRAAPAARGRARVRGAAAPRRRPRRRGARCGRSSASGSLLMRP